MTSVYYFKFPDARSKHLSNQCHVLVGEAFAAVTLEVKAHLVEAFAIGFVQTLRFNFEAALRRYERRTNGPPRAGDGLCS